MSKPNTWMPLYVGDYLADTMHLTGPEHGAYILLLMHSWRTGPLPDNDRQLAAIARTAPADWAEMAPTLRAFFKSTPEGLVQPRLEREREQAAAHAERRNKIASNAAAARWKPKAPAQVEAPSMPGAPPEEPRIDAPSNASSMLQALPQACSPPSPSPKEVEENPPTPRKRGRQVPEQDAFEEFWRHYPRKVGKGAARRAWARALQAAGGDADLVVGGVKVGLALERFDMREGGRYCPHPSTWLNGERWLDGLEAEDDQPMVAGAH